MHFSPLLQSSEKCHICLLILEARKQAEGRQVRPVRVRLSERGFDAVDEGVVEGQQRKGEQPQHALQPLHLDERHALRLPPRDLERSSVGSASISRLGIWIRAV